MTETAQNILVVDDDPTLRKLLQSTLASHGYKVKTAADGEKALEAYKAFQPDLIILDILMPKMDGYTFVLEFKKIGGNLKTTPVIILTSRESMQDIFEMEGINDYIVKPFEMEHLLRKIGRRLPSKEKKILLVDLDPQGNASSGLGFSRQNILHSSYDLIMGRSSVASTAVPTDFDGLSLIPANRDLTGAEIELVNVENREFQLKTALSLAKDTCDFILIDCPPSLGLLTVNALCAADSVILPIQCEYFALEGLTQLLSTIDLIKEHLNPSLEIEGILLTMHDSRTNLSRQVVEEVRKYFHEKVYNTIIPRNIRLGEAPSYGKPIINYDIRSLGAESYLQFGEELLRNNASMKQEAIK